jgi:hypothetical protein
MQASSAIDITYICMVTCQALLQSLCLGVDPRTHTGKLAVCDISLFP